MPSAKLRPSEMERDSSDVSAGGAAVSSGTDSATKIARPTTTCSPGKSAGREIGLEIVADMVMALFEALTRPLALLSPDIIPKLDQTRQ